MQFIDGLVEDHAIIEQVAGAFLTFAATLGSNERARDDGARFIRFFTEFAGAYHHAREEETLFPALVSRAELPVEGPISALTADHQRLAALLESAHEALTHTHVDASWLPPLGGRDGRAADSRGAGLCAVTSIRTYVHALWQHIDAENSVLLPESEARLRKQGLRELDGRAPTPSETAARDQGVALVAAYPPVTDDPSVVRGDGCVCCPLMTVTCGGLETAWWSEHEWDELEDHLGGD